MVFFYHHDRQAEVLTNRKKLLLEKMLSIGKFFIDVAFAFLAVLVTYICLNPLLNHQSDSGLGQRLVFSMK